MQSTKFILQASMSQLNRTIQIFDMSVKPLAKVKDQQGVNKNDATPTAVNKTQPVSTFYSSKLSHFAAQFLPIQQFLLTKPKRNRDHYCARGSSNINKTCYLLVINTKNVDCSIFYINTNQVSSFRLIVLKSTHN